MMKKLHNDGLQWFWRNSNDSRGVYYTDKNGEGVFFQSDKTGKTKQLIGTTQFSACETESGMRRKINRLFDDTTEDPRI